MPGQQADLTYMEVHPAEQQFPAYLLQINLYARNSAHIDRAIALWSLGYTRPHDCMSVRHS